MTDPVFNSPLEVKFIAETGLFEGYASVFDVTDSVNDQIARGAFADSLTEHKRSGRTPPLLWQHDAEQPIGAWRDLREDAHGLYVRGELFVADIPKAREAYRLMREGVLSGLSIGYRARKSHRDRKTGARVLTAIELLEISLVTFPANEFARVARVKSMLQSGQLPSEREFEALLRDAGLSRRQAKGVVADGYKSLSLHESPWDAADMRNLPRDADGEEILCHDIHALAERIRSLV